MNSDIFRLEEPSEALPLFDGWDETIVWSALDGTMGEIYANRAMTAGRMKRPCRHCSTMCRRAPITR